MIFNSLKARLLSATLLATLLFTLITAYALERAYRASLEAGVAEQLQLQIYNLLAVAERKDNRIELPFTLQDDRLNDPQSGLFAFAFSKSLLQWKSASTRWTLELESFLELKDLQPGASANGEWSMNGEHYFFRRFQVLWETGPDSSLPVQFVIMQKQAPFLAQIEEFRQRLWIWLAALGVGLAFTWLIVLQWGLTPLRRLAVELLRIEIGKQSKLIGSYPEEIAPISRNLNRVLHAEHDQRERYKQTLADLAHSLKTPLAVLKSTDQFTDIQDQVERMDQIIGYQLHRAIVSRATGYVGAQVNLKDQASRLVSALGKIYPEVNFTFDMSDPYVGVRMDEKDLMEVLGNLIENACKYGEGRVQISATSKRFSICDNGKGIPESDYERVLQRGVRLDSLDRGQGIGLAVVSDIVHSYGFSLKISESDMGGACFSVLYYQP